MQKLQCNSHSKLYAKIEFKSIEAMFVQDADLIDGLEAIGIARCLVTAGLLKTNSARKEGRSRIEFMRKYLKELQSEIEVN